jgi:hypothetical protein
MVQLANLLKQGFNLLRKKLQPDNQVNEKICEDVLHAQSDKQRRWALGAKEEEPHQTQQPQGQQQS